MARFPGLLQVLSFLALLALWQFAAIAIESRVLPTPVAVLEVLLDGFETGQIPKNIGITLARVAASFLLAMTIGIAIGIVMGRYKTVDRIFDGWLVLFLNIPALVTMILCYVWFGLTEVAAVTAVAVNKIPNVVVTIREGARVLDRGLLEMAQIFRLGRWTVLRHIVLPQLLPFIMAASRSGLALVWKIVLVVELLGRSNGVGFQLYTYFQLFDVAGILAYTLAFVAVIQLIELAILQPLEARISRWRR